MVSWVRVGKDNASIPTFTAEKRAAWKRFYCPNISEESGEKLTNNSEVFRVSARISVNLARCSRTNLRNISHNSSSSPSGGRSWLEREVGINAEKLGSIWFVQKPSVSRSQIYICAGFKLSYSGRRWLQPYYDSVDSFSCMKKKLHRLRDICKNCSLLYIPAWVPQCQKDKQFIGTGLRMSSSRWWRHVTVHLGSENRDWS